MKRPKKTKANDAPALPELGHVRQLVDAGLCVDVVAAEFLLAELGVRQVRGVFSRQALVAALEGRDGDEPDPGDGAAATLHEGLARFGLRLVSMTKGRTTTGSIAAIDKPRVVTVETVGSPLVIDSEGAVPARVYVAAQRRTGQAYFLAALDESVALYLFVLSAEGRFWIARREDSGDLRRRAQGRGERTARPAPLRRPPRFRPIHQALRVHPRLGRPWRPAGDRAAPADRRCHAATLLQP